MALNKKHLFLLLLLFFRPIFAEVAEIVLTKEMMTSIEQQGFYTSTKELENAPWPEFVVVVPLKISSLDAVSIFARYEEQKNYVPKVLSAKIARVVTPTDIHVDFEMHMPWPLPNTFYTTGNRLHHLGSKKFAVEWYYVQSDSTKDNKGQATFIPSPTNPNSSYLHYRSFIFPQSKFASLVKGKVQSDLVDTVKAIQQYLEEKKGQNPGIVEQYAQELTRLLTI